MRNYKTRGIILRSYDFGEADKIITIFGENHGKIKAVAKGVRKTKSRFGGRLEPFTYVHLMMAKGRNLDIITGAEIICPFQGIKSNLDRMTSGFGMLDILDKVSAEKQEEVEIFHLTLKALESLEKSSNNFSLLLAAFDIKLVAYSGYLPDLSSCVICKKTPPFSRYLFSYEQGGILCPECNLNSPMTRIISDKALSVLKSILQEDLDTLENIKISSDLEKEITSFLNDYIDYYLQTRLKSREYLSKVK